MRHITYISLIVLSLTGCAFLEQRKVDWQTCKQDPICYESATKWKSTGEVVGGLAGSAFPGAAMPAQKVTGWIAFAIAMIVGGHAINKKKETPNG